MIYMVAETYYSACVNAGSLLLRKNEFIYCSIYDIGSKLRGLGSKSLVIVCSPLNPKENRDLKRFVMESKAYAVPFNSVYPGLIDMHKQNKEKDLNYFEQAKQKFTTGIDTGVLSMIEEENLLYNLQVALREKLICCLCKIPVAYDMERDFQSDDVVIRMRCHGREEKLYLARSKVILSKLDPLLLLLDVLKPFYNDYLILNKEKSGKREGVIKGKTKKEKLGKRNIDL